MSQRTLLNGLLLLSALLLPLSFHIVPTANVALSLSAPWWHHLTFHFFHAGPLHWLLNCAALLSIAFHFRLSWGNLLGAFLLCSLLPPFTPLPVIGLSSIVFYLFGRCALATARPRRFVLIVSLSIACGLFFPHIAVGLHAAAFSAGLTIAALNYPFFKKEE